MLARTCNRKACELAQFETTLRMALPGARTSCRACHVRCRHDVEPEERSKLNRNKYHVIRCWKAVQKIAGRCLALRLPLPSSGRLMRIHRPVVQTFMSSMLDRGHHGVGATGARRPLRETTPAVPATVWGQP